MNQRQLTFPEAVKTCFAKYLCWCLSFPNQFAKVIRPAEVVAEYTDRDGKRRKIKGKELLAQAICHETDHLDGELFTEKMEPGTLEYVKPE